jgi:hypothetical protein
VLDEVRLLGLDVERLLDRFFEYESKKASKGSPIADRSAYLLKMAREEVAKSNGVSAEDLKGITSPDERKRGETYARAMGTPPVLRLPDQRRRQRLAMQLERAGLCPRETEQKWHSACSNRATRLDYEGYASLLLRTARHPIGIRMASISGHLGASPAPRDSEEAS